MDDALAVRVAERSGNLERKIHRMKRVERTVVLEILLESDAVHQLHDNILNVIRAAHIVYTDDVRMAQLGDRLRFRLEAAAELFILGKLGPHDLYCDVPVEPVTHCFIYNRHAAAADRFEKLVPAVKHNAAVFILFVRIHIVPP